MKIKELVEKLSKFDPELEIVMSKDSEGNCFSPCNEAEPCHYVPDSTWSGDVHPCGKGKETAICLWPVN